jgi:hypothetical protein
MGTSVVLMAFFASLDVFGMPQINGMFIMLRYKHCEVRLATANPIGVISQFRQKTANPEE